MYRFDKAVNISETNLQEFVNVLARCKDNVYLVTDEGDEINLKSQFCRIIGLHHVINGGRFAGGRLECENDDDAALLFRFNIFGNDR